MRAVVYVDVEDVMKYHLITAAFLIAAVFCYVVGSTAGAIVFAAVGLVLESVFWFRLFKRRPER